MINNNLRDRPLYRSRDSIFLGVCRGFAEWIGFSVFWTRVITLILGVIFMPIPLIIYFGMAFLMKKEPSDYEQGSFTTETFAGAKTRLRRMKETLADLEERAAKLERAALNRENDWDRRFHRG